MLSENEDEQCEWRWKSDGRKIKCSTVIWGTCPSRMGEGQQDSGDFSYTVLTVPWVDFEKVRIFEAKESYNVALFCWINHSLLFSLFSLLSPNLPHLTLFLVPCLCLYLLHTQCQVLFPKHGDLQAPGEYV